MAWMQRGSAVGAVVRLRGWEGQGLTSEPVGTAVGLFRRSRVCQRAAWVVSAGSQ